MKNVFSILDTKQIDRLFPYYIVVDSSLKIIDYGKKLERITPIETGDNINDICFCSRPYYEELDFENLKSLTNQVVILKCKQGNKIKLRGQLEYIEANNTLLFYGSPWFYDIDELTKMGLTFNDFAISDPLVDLLQLLKNQEIVNKDIKDLLSRINDQKQQIQKREAKYSDLLANLYDAVVVLDEHGNIMECNKALCKMTGYTEQELLKLSTKDITHPDDIPRAKSTVEILIKHKAFNELGIRCIRKDGTVFDVAISSTAIFENGEYKGSRDILRDVTEKKRIEEKLRDLSLVAEESSNLVIITGRDKKIEWVNKSFVEVSGYALDEIIGKSPGQFLQGKGSDTETIKAISLALKNEQSFAGIILNYKKDGTPYWVELVINPVKDTQGNLVKFISISTDVTERIEHEKELQHAKDQAEKAFQDKNHFIATMSHEIRTPLNAIIGLTNLMIMEGPPKEISSNLEILRFSANHLLSLINDILDLSKIDAGKIEFSNAPFNLHELLKGVYQTFYIKAEQKGLDFQFNIDPNIPDTLKGDTLRLTQVLNNLVNNAVKFTDKGGITISVKDLESSGKKHTLLFEVADTGIGIDDEEQANIFESFKQANKEISQKYGGTGLGLYICKQLIEAQGGKLEIKSTKGAGTTIQFTIVYATGKEKDLLESSLNNAAKDKVNARILLVEDNIINQKVALSYLNHWGATSDVANNGREGLNKFLENDYDILLVDLIMPEMNGYEAIAEIRKTKKGKHVPIIAFTASAEVNAINRALEAGADSYVLKPFEVNDLLSKLKAAMKKNTNPTENTKHKTDNEDTGFSVEPAFKSINLHRIKDASLGNDDFVREMVVMLIEEIPTFFLNSEKFLTENRLEDFANEIHKLKNSILMLGFEHLRQHMQKLENIAREGKHADKVGEMFDKLTHEWEGAIDDIGKLKKWMSIEIE